MRIITLSRLDRFLRTDTSYLARGSFWLIIGKISWLAIAFFLSVLYARLLSKEVYGNYRYILSIVGVLGIFALPGMPTAIIRSVARGFEGTFRKAAKIIFFFSFTIPLAGAMIGLFFFQRGSFDIAAGIFFASLLSPFAEGLGNWRSYFDGKREFQKKTLLNLTAHLMRGFIMVNVVLFIYIASLNAIYAVILLATASMFSQAVPNTIFFLRTIREVSKHAPVEPGSIAYGIHKSFAAIPSTIAFSIDGILLYAFLGPTALAVYSIATAIPEQLKALVLSATDVAFPKISRKMTDPEQRRALQKTIFQKIIRAMFFIVALVIFYVITAPFLYTLFFPQYREAIFFTQIYALPLILLPFSVFDTMITAEGNIKKIYAYNISSPVIQISALALLIPFFGIWGAIIARIIGRILNYIFLFVLFKIK